MSVVDCGTWDSFEKVKDCERRGFVLGHGIGCVDFDDCVHDGVLDERVVRLLAYAPDTFVEFSPSGSGIHVWGRLPEGLGRMFTRKDGVKVEFYSRGRYMTVTGRRVPKMSRRVLGDLRSFTRVLLS